MADIDDNDKQTVPLNHVDNTVASYPIGIMAAELPFERLSLIRISSQIIEGLGYPPVNGRFASGNPGQGFFCLTGKL